jgi:hypothetical protein
MEVVVVAVVVWWVVGAVREILCQDAAGPVIPFASRALPTETKVEGGTSQSRSATSANLSNIPKHDSPYHPPPALSV